MMGFRTTVILYNDQAREWENDSKLGRKIAEASAGTFWQESRELPFGKVVECVHADEQSLAVIDGYSITKLAYTRWRPGQDNAARDLNLLQLAADKLGYALVKKG